MAELVREIVEADIPRVKELLALADQGGALCWDRTSWRDD